MNPGAVLALISELYEKVAALTHDNEQLRTALAEATAEPEPQPEVP